MPKASGKAADFHKQYKEFFAENAFTDDLALYWREALAAEPERKAEVIQESVAFASEALAAALVKEPTDIASAGNALDWLNELYGNVDEATWPSVGDALGAVRDFDVLDDYLKDYARERLKSKVAASPGLAEFERYLQNERATAFAPMVKRINKSRAQGELQEEFARYVLG